MSGRNDADGTSGTSYAAVNSVTNTGAALTWTRAAWSNNQWGTAEIWWALTTPAHAAMTVTATLSDAMANSMRVVTFSRASPLDGAATAIASAASGAHLAPAATLTTTRASSLVFMVGTDTQGSRTMVAPAGQTVVGQSNSLSNTFWVQRTTAGVPTAGTAVTMTSTYTPASFPDRWNVAVIEIRTP